MPIIYSERRSFTQSQLQIFGVMSQCTTTYTYSFEKVELACSFFLKIASNPPYEMNISYMQMKNDFEKKHSKQSSQINSNNKASLITNFY
jgi:hypothetical protein